MDVDVDRCYRDAGEVTLRLRCRQPLAAAELLAFLKARAVPGVEEVADGRYRRSVDVDGTTSVLALELVSPRDHVLLSLRAPSTRGLAEVVHRARRLLALDADVTAAEGVLSADPYVAPLVGGRPGLRIPGSYDGFETAVRVLLGQQVSVAGASTLTGRVVQAAGVRLAEPSGGVTHSFPTPESLAEAPLHGLGLTTSRANSLHALSAAVQNGDVVLDGSAEPGETRAALLGLPGVGPWTVEVVALRVLGDPDAFPVTDLGLRRAAESVGLPSAPRQLLAHAHAWRPWRGYALLHLWTHLSDKGTRR